MWFHSLFNLQSCVQSLHHKIKEKSDLIIQKILKIQTAKILKILRKKLARFFR